MSGANDLYHKCKHPQGAGPSIRPSLLKVLKRPATGFAWCCLHGRNMPWAKSLPMRQCCACWLPLLVVNVPSQEQAWRTINITVASTYQHMAQVTRRLAFLDVILTGIVIFWIRWGANRCSLTIQGSVVRRIGSSFCLPLTDHPTMCDICHYIDRDSIVKR